MKLLLCFALTIAAWAQNDGLAPAPEWRTQSGDNSGWASAQFDDSTWTASPPPRRYNSFTNPIRGYQWYRATFRLPEWMWSQKLGVGMGALDEVYDVYVEGVRVGQFGKWDPKPESPMNTHRAFAIPEGVVKGPVVHVAIRRWTGATAANFRSLQATGLDRDAHEPRLGLAGLISTEESLHLSSGPAAVLVQIARILTEFVSGLLILILYLTNRRRSTPYLLLSLCFLVEAMGNFVGTFVAITGLSRRGPLAGAAVALEYSAPVFLAMFFALGIGRSRWRWLPYALAASTASSCIRGSLSMMTQWTWLFSGRAGYERAILTAWQPLMETAIVLVLAAKLFRERRIGSVVLSVVLILHSVVTFSFFRSLLPQNVLVWGPVRADIRDLSGLLLPLAALVYVYLAYRDEQERHLGVERDLLAARRAQQILLESGDQQTPGFAIEKQYLPAHEVGGDFYQCIPQPGGALLLLAGDVSGKGLDAAMLAASMIGVARGAGIARPGELLARLNAAAIGRTRGGFVTCCCALLESDGRIRIANAGHLAPYLDGAELSVQTGLPLGVAAEVVYAEDFASLVDGCQFTIVSDGVVEAANLKGELFGFDRTAGIAGKSAAVIAEAARAWGQNDDITVLTVRRAVA